MMDPELKAIYDTIDWSKHSLLTATCHCGQVFRTMGKAKITKTGFMTIAKDPCPNCGNHANLRGLSSDWESMTISPRNTKKKDMDGQAGNS